MVSFSPTRRQVLAASSALSLGFIAIAGGAVASAHHTVVVEVDGVSQPISGFDPTVGDVLATAGVEINEHDLVAPATDQSTSDDQTIVVRSASPYSVTVDGRSVQAWSTGTSIRDVLGSVEGDAVVLAADRSSARADLPIVTDSGTVTVRADGDSTEVQVSARDDVTSLLAKADVEVTPIDRVVFTHSDGATSLDVTRVTRGTRTETTSIAFPTQEREDDTVEQGSQKVLQEGKDGSESTTFYEETVDGKAVVSVKVGHKKSDPVPRIVAIGTKEPEVEETVTASTPSDSASTEAAPTSSVGGDVWAALAQCESGGNPATNTGNGYYGLYQFNLGTWQSLGGQGLPSDNSAAEQTRIAQALQARSGWGQWPACAASLGLY